MTGALAGAVVAGAAWGWFEAGWVRLATRRVTIPGLPSELEGLRIMHLSDFHLGLPSRGADAARRAVRWAIERQPELTRDLRHQLGPRPRPSRGEPLDHLPIAAEHGDLHAA